MPEPLQCPSCGHHLSMFAEAEPTPGERRATRVADAVASWRFPVVLVVLIAAWVVVNLITQPLDPHPQVMLTGLGAALATIAACQGPLILLTQRRAALRDRARDRETYLVATHTEADLHALTSKVDAIASHLGINDERSGR